MSAPPVGMRLAADVLPDQRAPARRGPQAVPAPALPVRKGSTVEPRADSGTAPSASMAERHVRRAIALAELSLLVLDQD